MSGLSPPDPHVVAGGFKRDAKPLPLMLAGGPSAAKPHLWSSLWTTKANPQKHQLVGHLMADRVGFEPTIRF